MEIEGKIVEILPEKSGSSKNGSWRKQEYVLETYGQYPKKICFMVWGDKIDQFEINRDEQVVVSVDLESREHNGRWYTDVKAWKIDKAGHVSRATEKSVQYTNEVTPNAVSSVRYDDTPF